MSTIAIKNDRIVVDTLSWVQDEMRAAPNAHGAYGSNGRLYWHFQRTPANALMVDELMRKIAPDEVSLSGEFQAYLGHALEDSKRAAAIKSHTNLNNIPGILRTAWEHQRQAYWWAREQEGAMLAMEMGTGKTLIALGLIAQHKHALILCPTSVREVWRSEVEASLGEQWAANTVVISSKQSVKKRLAEIRRALMFPNSIVVINYEAAWRGEVGKLLRATNWDIVVADESHRIKAPGGKASRFVASLAAKQRLALTGTPTPHSPMDLYAQFRFIDSSIFGTRLSIFKANYAHVMQRQTRQGQRYEDITGWRNQDDFRQRFERASFSVRAEDVLDLPSVQHIVRTASFEPPARRAYNELRRDFITWLNDEEAVVAANVLTRLLRLQQFTGGSTVAETLAGERQTEQVSAAKALLLQDTLDGLPQSEPVVVFAQFRADLDRIAEAASSQGRRYAELSGRSNMLSEWQDGQADVLGVQIRSGGVGVDLTRARYGVYYSTGFSLGDYEQSLARLHRPGQERPVVYYHLHISNSIDGYVARALREKRDIIQEVMHGRLEI